MPSSTVSASAVHQSGMCGGVLDSLPLPREELVVLVDEHARPIGTLPKAVVHHRATPLHLGFSCYLFDRRGQVLLTRRALTKRTWPGVWTNSCCGHPLPDEPLSEAVRRRARHELGLQIDHLECVLPHFRYRATATDGTVENELCPVFFARAQGPVQPAADEVMDWRWVSWPELRAAAELSWPLSPWAAAQILLLEDADLGRWR
ncbi:isopentenyl-diphosphate delta-isomerase [Mycobacterium xenopi]|uniref:Isopentenyl-diphosphate Delta-isomerase n=2 Tax=Mycobacterium xenopi TaxID=1789 RepID=A0AAD1M2S4_MYCXE|nr:isopentenyl-diphosphate Delta-isomerase [Mycobacterium xenopi]SPX90174.1 isopentenyl-diphosphate delta-isomerase [Mycobacterium xenopi]